MPFPVYISFEGLFVFVNRTKTVKGVYALMANTENAVMKHCHKDAHVPNGIPHHPNHEGKVTFGNGNERDFYEHLDLRNVLTGGSKSVVSGLPLTKATGQRVALSLLDEPIANVSARLIGRVLLPQPASIDLEGTVAADWLDPETNKWVRVKDVVSGKITLGYEAKDAITIAEFGTVDSANPQISFTHLPDTPIPNVAYKKETCFLHAHMHSPLFNDVAADLRTGTISKPGGPKNAPAAAPPFFGLEPVVCTAGNGCPEDEPGCDQ
jgi:hypothetical protein